MKLIFATAVVLVLLPLHLAARPEDGATLTRGSLPVGVILTSGPEVNLTDQTLGCLVLVTAKLKVIRGLRIFDLPIEAAAGNLKQAQDYFEIDRDALNAGQEYDTIWVLATLQAGTGLIAYQETKRHGHRYLRVSPSRDKDSELAKIGLQIDQAHPDLTTPR